MIGASVMFSLSGVDKTRFIEHVKAAPHTYADWAYGQWTIETTGKEDEMFSPFLRKPFERARAQGLIPENLDTISGTWGALYDTGDLTYMNLVHLLGYDGTDPNDLTRGEMEGRAQAMMFEPGLSLPGRAIHPSLKNGDCFMTIPGLPWNQRRGTGILTGWT